MSDVDEFDDAEFDFEEGDEDEREAIAKAEEQERRHNEAQRARVRRVEAAPPTPVTPPQVTPKADVDADWRAWTAACALLGLPVHAADAETESRATCEEVLEAIFTSRSPIAYQADRIAGELEDLATLAEDQEMPRETLAWELREAVAHRARMLAKMTTAAVEAFREALAPA